MSDEIKKPHKWSPHKWGWLVLFASIPTLFCCALPILLVSLGMGATVAAMYDSLPFLSFIGLHSSWTFAITAVILLLAGWVLYRPNRTCPTDPKLANACQSANKWNVRLFWGAVLVWCIGAFSAFVLPYFA